MSIQRRKIAFLQKTIHSSEMLKLQKYFPCDPEEGMVLYEILNTSIMKDNDIMVHDSVQ